MRVLSFAGTGVLVVAVLLVFFWENCCTSIQSSFARVNEGVTYHVHRQACLPSPRTVSDTEAITPCTIPRVNRVKWGSMTERSDLPLRIGEL